MEKQDKLSRRSSDEKIAKMEKDIEYIKESHIQSDIKFDKFMLHIDKKFDAINKRFDSLPGKFASKYVERAFWGVLGVVFTSIVAGVMNLVLR